MNSRFVEFPEFGLTVVMDDDETAEFVQWGLDEADDDEDDRCVDQDPRVGYMINA